MVRVVHEGPSEHVFHTRCPNCTSRLEYTKRDVRRNYDFAGDTTVLVDYDYIQCPACGAKAMV